jgi:hypothetical protein
VRSRVCGAAAAMTGTEAAAPAAHVAPRRFFVGGNWKCVRARPPRAAAAPPHLWPSAAGRRARRLIRRLPRRAAPRRTARWRP